MVDDPERGHRGEHVRDLHVVVAHPVVVVAEEVEGADRPVPQLHGNGVGDEDAAGTRLARERRPALGRPVQAGADEPAGHERLQARTLVVLELEELQQVRLLARGREHAQVAPLVVEHDPRAAHREVLQAADDELVRQVDHVEAGHERVRQRHEPREEPFTVERHRGPLLQRHHGLVHPGTHLHAS
jgi:hypothetical protein